jgi:hypothetical protein
VFSVRASRPFQNNTSPFRRGTPSRAVTSSHLVSDHSPHGDCHAQNIIIIEREHVPVEQIAYIEPFETPANGQFKPEKAYKGRVVLINRETVLTEDTPQAFAEANEFRLLPEDNVATVTSGAKLTEKQRFEFAEVWCPGECRFRWRFS